VKDVDTNANRAARGPDRAGRSFRSGCQPVENSEKTVMSTTKRITRVTLAKRVRDLVAGTQKHAPSGQFTLSGQEFTAQSLIQALESLENAISKVDSAKAGWKDAMKELAAIKAKVDPVMGAYMRWVEATFGTAPATLAELGLAPPKTRTPMTAEKKAVAVAKRLATREARHTKGPKQKAAIKGDVKVEIVTTPTAAPPAKTS
jgi:hypothetical protein